ncbi:hypothetical protein GE107_18295 [Cohnella sp. CFH 77786]|uniref:hypothetical protein n=1 Tax=Cohnella sp. CFH 77786 TaxID=2662265 RepID=UPI001C60E276|nr:hypothetical protein [Cohnella sp. CFH 77786]MBW5448010.1 hypothetical protein [Cohnella sp. CFH 77786]
MDETKLARYCELKTEIGRMEDELDALREEIIDAYTDDAEVEVGPYKLKIIYQEKKQYNEQLLFEALPDPELWKHVSKADASRIAALIKANVLSEKLIRGTYRISRTPYLYVDIKG